MVFYVFCGNDLRGIYENGLFHLDETGALTRNPAIERSPWVSLLSKLHMTYLAIDGTRRLASLAKGKTEDVVDKFLEASGDINVELLREGRKERFRSAGAWALESDVNDGEAESELAKDVVLVFQSLLRTWQQMVQERGGRFVVAILPRPQEGRMAAMIPPEIDRVNLFECFNEYVAEYSYAAPDWRFVNDSHWNEQGNMLAAVCLYRFLERELNLPVRSIDELLGQLHRYYAAFQDEGRRNYSTTPTSTRPRDSADIGRLLEQRHRPIFQTWMPLEEWTRPMSVQPRDLAAIRSKYLALSPISQISGSLEHSRLVARSTFDLYLGEDRLIYVKAPCAPEDTEARFFLHVHPADVNALPVARRRYGFDNLNFGFDGEGLIFDDDICVASAQLPRYDIVRISTGQFVAGEGRIWHEEFALGAGRAPDAERAAATDSPGRTL